MPEPAAGSRARVLVIDDAAFAGSSINVVAGVQNTLFTSDGVQYAAYYAADGALMLARRPVGEDRWMTKRTGYKADVNDAHRNVALAVDGEGYLHVAWNLHVNPLNYARSIAPSSLELGPRQPMTGKLETSVTYPQFLRLPDGDLLFLYRDGRSGSGNLVLNRYLTASRRWTRVQTNLVDGEGQHSAYPTAFVDRRGVLHLAWNWRDSSDVSSNHDLCYARSSDGGVTWTSASGAALTVPFTVDNADYALRVPTGRSLMNSPALSVDAKGQPILASYWSPDGSNVPQYHVVHFDGKTWRVSQATMRKTSFTLSGTATKRPLLSRSVLLPYRGWQKPQELHLIFRDDERGGRIVLTSCLNLDAAKPVWRQCDLTASSVGAWEPTLDPEQATRLNQLQMLVQDVAQRDGNDALAASAPPTPIASLIWSPFLANMGSATAAVSPAHVTSSTAATAPRGDEILSLLRRVADWQLKQPYPPGRDLRGWEIAPFYMGVLALGEIPGEKKYLGLLRTAFDQLEWKPGPHRYNADDQCVIQAYLQLYRLDPAPARLLPSRTRLDEILKAPSSARMGWGAGNSTERWTWADSLFMAPAAWLGMSQCTNDPRYAEFAHHEWWAASAALYRREDGWFARDESFLDLREPNHHRLYWSRGNGWVAAGLVNILKILRPDDPERPRYIALYREMMASALAAQQPDGLWRSGLLDPDTHPARESSGSAFLTYALAYGIHCGLLERDTTEPAVWRAWLALAACVTSEGKLEHVQPIGSAPEGFDPHHNDWFGAGALLLAGTEVYAIAAEAQDKVAASASHEVAPEMMQAIYDEVKTPFKYGVVIEPPPGKKVDCPTVFRHGDKWYMVYVELENKPAEGYTTQLAESGDLLHWKPLGTILERGAKGTWDQANAGGGVALFDPNWEGDNALGTYDGHYWLSYMGGREFGYEAPPIFIGMAFTDDPTKPLPWRKLSAPVLRSDDPSARAGRETATLFKSFIFRDDSRSLGAPFVMFYNAKGDNERIFAAISQDMKTWQRFGAGPVLDNPAPPDAKRGVISGDPQIARMDDVWVMFYFGAFWKPGAFNTFAASRDLVHWTKWTGEDLVKPSEPYDTPYAHKSWVIKHDGVVYHFYCAVGGRDQHRAIALATSKDLKPPADSSPPLKPATQNPR